MGACGYFSCGKQPRQNRAGTLVDENTPIDRMGSGSHLYQPIRQFNWLRIILRHVLGPRRLKSPQVYF